MHGDGLYREKVERSRKLPVRALSGEDDEISGGVRGGGAEIVPIDSIGQLRAGGQALRMNYQASGCRAAEDRRKGIDDNGWGDRRNAIDQGTGRIGGRCHRVENGRCMGAN